MDWTRAVDIYCERVSAAFWAEPVNALTNVIFILAGFAALGLEARRSGRGFGPTLWLALVLAIAIVAIVSQVIGAVWAATASDAPLWLVIVTTAATLAILAFALTWAPAAFPDPGISWPVLWLSANAAVVGVGSFLFHTVAEPWAGAADGGPILMFILGYFIVAMNRYVGLGWGRAVLATLGFLAGMALLSTALRPLDDILGGSQSYVPALVALAGVGLWLSRRRDHPAGAALVQAAGLFAVSLTFRTLDGPLCDVFPLGTHFLWHIFNGLVFWVLLRALIRHGAAPVAAGGARAAA
jgi:hypothetical protein